MKKVIKKPIFASGETSNIYKDGDYILKIYNPIYLEIAKINDNDIEKKMLAAKKIETIPEIEIPVSALYDLNNKRFVGVKSNYIKGINRYNFMKENLDYNQIIKDYDYFEDIFKRAKKEAIVFPDFANDNNIMIYKNKDGSKAIKLIDYDGIQTKDFSTMTYATVLEPFFITPTMVSKKELESEKLIFTPKYKKGNFFTQELNIYSEYVLFFLDLLGVSIPQIEQLLSFYNDTVAFDIFFKTIGLDDYDIQDKIWKLFNQTKQNEYLEADKYKIIENYDIKFLGNSYGKKARKLVRKK